MAAPIALAPTLAGSWSPGTGARAEFRAIDSAWRDSAVLWSEDERRFANGTSTGTYRPVGEYAWGTGLWGLADWHRLHGGELDPIARWSGVVAAVDHGNLSYAANWAATWGEALPLPMSIPEENWTVSYSGYLRITEADDYNFGVLYDDGFFLRIHGADGESVEISSDFIITARERLGFDSDLSLQEGLYRFELGAYNRLEAGVAQLAWQRGGSDWETVPTEHLVVDPTRIPLPGTLVMIAFGGAGIVVSRKRSSR